FADVGRSVRGRRPGDPNRHIPSSRRPPMGSNSRQSGRSPSSRGGVIPLLGTEIPLDADLTRRDLLRYAGYGSMAAFLAACGTGSQGGQQATTAKGGQLSVGSNQSDPAPKSGMETINSAFTKANGG